MRSQSPECVYPSDSHWPTTHLKASSNEARLMCLRATSESSKTKAVCIPLDTYEYDQASIGTALFNRLDDVQAFYLSGSEVSKIG